jgi:hemolysin III
MAMREPAPAPDQPAHEKFSITMFVLQVLGQCALLLLALRLAFPAVWTRQFAGGWGPLVLVFLGMHLFVCFFEWFFHRYVLHSVTTRWLSAFARAHRNHHGLTPIRLQAAPDGPGRCVLNRYPIVEEEQHEDSAFPWYALLGFWAFFTPLILLVQWALPSAPVLVGSYAAIAWSMFLYEILHAIEHQPYEWWKRATEHPRVGGLWSSIYGFHHMHHANISCNEAISGFFGLPLADWAFGTFHQPQDLLLEGRMATARDFAIKPPPRLVRWLDDWARRREAAEIRRQR